MASIGNVNILFLEGFNNYYNRIHKQYDTLAEYTDLAIPMIARTSYNFNPSGGVDAKIQITYNESDTILSPDYIIVYDNSNNILSRWFVLDENRIRGSQYEYTLRRDVISDNFESVISAPSFIEKATLDNDDDGIFNNENMSFNQIKVDEKLLMDDTKCGWIVGYVARNYAGTDSTASFDGAVISDYDVSDIEDYPLYQYLSPGVNNKTYYYNNFDFATTELNISFRKSGVTQRAVYKNNQFISITDGPIALADLNYICTLSFKTQMIANMRADMADISRYDTAIQNSLLADQGKIIHTDAANYNIVAYSYGAETAVYDALTTLNIKNFLNNIIGNYAVGVEMTVQRNTRVAAWLTPASGNKTYYVNMPGQGERYHLKDQPYDMFCIPYSKDPIRIVNTSDNTFVEFDFTSTTALMMAQGLTTVLGSNLYDIQLLPYCPMTNIWRVGDELDIRTPTASPQRRYTLIKDGTSQVAEFIGILLWATNATGSRNIPVSIPSVEPKIENECDLWRLNSPNYASVFEFSVAKNRGVYNFNVDFTYKPYQPYIHINPTWNGIYGSDFNDSRGLILGGDYSLPMISNAWSEYQIQNKNWNAMFERQIDHMEFINEKQQLSDILGATVGTFTGAAAGAAAGTMIGNPAGGLLGGLAGGAASMLGGMGDVAINRAMRNEALDYTKDNFNYQLGNIKARPNSVQKVGALSPNNKIFPFLEKYTCTDIERQALRDKIKYDGMTVMRIGKVEDFIKPEKTYIKGKLIRIEDVPVDTHMLNAIAEELNKGVFM